MGSCFSSRSPGDAAVPDGTMNFFSSSSSLMICSQYWNKKRKEKKKKNKNRKKRRRRTEDNESNGVPGRDTDDHRLQDSGASSGVVDEDELHRVPGRMFLNGATENACLFTQQGKKGTNQDAMLVWENFASRNDTIFCGVFDGHGPFGHMVAKKVRDSLPLKLCTEWRGNFSSHNSPHQNGILLGKRNSEETSSGVDDEWGEPLNVDENEKLPEIYLTLRQSFLKAFKSMDKELKLHTNIDCFCSGTTTVAVIKQGQDLVIGNVGDSRAILGTRDKDDNLVAVQLTVDLKPNLPREAARIHQCRGRVFALQDEPEVARVWLPNNDSPGLAMARAFGDFCLKDYGLISVPDISYRRLTEKDEFIVLATDGVWDALSNKEVVDIVVSAPTRGTAARALVDHAVRSWRLKFPTSKIDDCAAVCLFLLDISSPSNQNQENNFDGSPVEPKKLDSLTLASQDETNKEEFHESFNNTAQTISSTSCSHIDTNEIVPVSDESKTEMIPERSKSTRSIADCISVSEEEEWSALEGVTRVNSLLTLPRFLSGDKRSTSRKKWL